MVKISFKNARFVKTAVKPEGYPILRDDSGNILPEIAIAGRSNVGKSSLINHLFQTKNLAKTSSVPGKTQAINFFTLDEEFAFVDLPGYGYAQVPISIRKNWGPMVQTYLEKRDSLKLILFLFDIRRKPNEDDISLLEWIQHFGKPMIIIFTKVDKVNLNERKNNAKKILKDLNLENVYNTYYSTTKNIGRKELIQLILAALQENMPQ